MSNQALPLERSWYIGIIMTAIGYGIQLTMYFHSVYYLSSGSNIKWTKDTFYIGYGAVLLIFGTIALSTNAFYGQSMWIEHRDVEGGPVAYFTQNIALWYNTFGTASSIAINTMGDGLMLYRFYIIFGSRVWVAMFPAVLYLGSVSMSIVMAIQSGVPNGNIFSGTAVNFGTPWLALTITFNVIVTSMISGRLLLMQRQMKKILGPDIASPYVGVVAILVESALPFTLVGIAYVVVYATGNPIALAFAGVWGVISGISPQAIVLRVAMGSGWSKETLSTMTGPIAFANHAGESTHNDDAPPKLETRTDGSSTRINASSTRIGLENKPSATSLYQPW